MNLINSSNLQVKILPMLSITHAMNLNNTFPPPFEHEMNFGIISQLEVYNTLKYLDPKSSLDIMGISSKLLKYIASEISRPLTHIYSLSLSTGVFLIV